MRPCQVCAEPISETRGRRYCSVGCRKAAERQRERDRRVEEFQAAAADVPRTGDRDEVLGLLLVAAKLGSVQAAKILLDELRRDGGAQPTGIIDELASRRHR